MNFEGLGLCFWSDFPVWKCPNRGEWFASGAVVSGYRARQHLTTEYWVVRPTHYAENVTTARRRGAVQFTQGGLPLPRRRVEA
nr:hypothetical protein [Nannocystis sp.]